MDQIVFARRLEIVLYQKLIMFVTLTFNVMTEVFFFSDLCSAAAMNFGKIDIPSFYRSRLWKKERHAN